MVRLHHADGPRTGESAPDCMRHLGSNSKPAVGAENEELGNVGNGLIGGSVQTVLDEHESCPFAIDLDEEWMAAWRLPIERQVRVDECTVRAYLKWEELTEVVDVELKQVGDDGLLRKRSGDEVNFGHRTYAASFAGSSAWKPSALAASSRCGDAETKMISVP